MKSLLILTTLLLSLLSIPPTFVDGAFLLPTPSPHQRAATYSLQTRMIAYSHNNHQQLSLLSLRNSLRQFDDNFDNDRKDDLGNIQIPSTGVSITDQMESSEKDRFQSELIPIAGMKKIAAQIVTTATRRGSFEPVRYLISLSPPSSSENDRAFVLVDIPPFSPTLFAQIKEFMGSKAHLAAILLTSRDAIHYDDAPAVYKMRRTDLELWKQAFPGLEIIAYRLDIPRDCRESVTQVLDGYGPFALNESALASKMENSTQNATSQYNLFMETGKPLSFMEWDYDEAQDILRGRKPYNDGNDTVDEEYSSAAIRKREEDKRVLAVYTPGYTFGSVSYIFPKVGICCSGFTIPVEDTRDEDNPGMAATGPALDCRGYITTNRGGIDKQMQSSRHLINTYCDRFNTILASRGDPLVLEGECEEKRDILLDIIDQYDKIGKIYDQLGITSSYDDDYNNDGGE